MNETQRTQDPIMALSYAYHGRMWGFMVRFDGNLDETCGLVVAFLGHEVGYGKMPGW